jgi:hypothetical protein
MKTLETYSRIARGWVLRKEDHLPAPEGVEQWIVYANAIVAGRIPKAFQPPVPPLKKRNGKENIVKELVSIR